MVWNKELAKLKQELKSEEGTPPKPPIPKAAPKPEAPRPLEDEDALFLAVMGKRRPPAEPLQERVAQPTENQVPKPVPAKAEFKEAMASLKGVKPVEKSKVLAPDPSPKPPPPEVIAEATPVPNLLEPPTHTEPSSQEPAPEPTTVRNLPSIIQLAAGMAIEVDATLDLRGHSSMDAMERLKERLLDGHLLGWRTLHVLLGPSEELRQSLQEFLSAGSESELIARYAQAPIPMGGAQAWILYLGIQGSTTHQEGK